MNLESSVKQTEAATPAPDVIKVLIIEDMREVREGLAALINGTRGFSCSDSYYSMEAALAGKSDQSPDVILTDIGLPGMSGIEGIEFLRRQAIKDFPNKTWESGTDRWRRGLESVFSRRSTGADG